MFHKKIYIFVIIIISVISLMLLFFYGNKILSYRYFETQYIGENYDVLQSMEGDTKEFLHNMGNVYYKLFEVSGDPENLESSLASYNSSLSISEHLDTRYNYEYVKDLLDQIQEQENNEEESNSEEQNSESENQSGSEENESSDNSSSDSSQATTNERGEEYMMGEETAIDPLSEDERNILEQRLEELSRDQRRNQQFFGQENQENISEFDSMFESFFGEIDRRGEKDW